MVGAMTTSTLAVIILIATMSFFAMSRASRRPGKNNASLVLASRFLAVLIFALVVYYFYLRFAG